VWCARSACQQLHTAVMDAGLLTFKAAAGVSGSSQLQAPSAVTEGSTGAGASTLSMDIKSAKQAVTQVGARFDQPLAQWHSRTVCGTWGE
jgi:hypothetical protein